MLDVLSNVRSSNSAPEAHLQHFSRDPECSRLPLGPLVSQFKGKRKITQKDQSMTKLTPRALGFDSQI